MKNEKKQVNLEDVNGGVRMSEARKEARENFKKDGLKGVLEGTGLDLLSNISGGSGKDAGLANAAAGILNGLDNDLPEVQEKKKKMAAELLGKVSGGSGIDAGLANAAAGILNGLDNDLPEVQEKKKKMAAELLG